MTSLRHDGHALADLGTMPIRVDVGGHRAEFLYWGFYRTSPWRNYFHTHSFFEVCYAYAGSGIFRVGADEHPVKSGTLFVARPGDLHEIEPAADDPLGICFWSYTLLPDRARHGGDAGRQLLQAFSAPGAPAVSTSAGPVAVVLEQLTREAALPGAASDEIVATLAQSLLLETARAVVPDLPRGARNRALSREQLIVRTMTQYLQDNQDRAVSVRDVAAQVHLSERHANRLFRAATGTTIHAYLTQIRLEAAAQRLLERGTSIKEIAHSCGYSDVRHFTTAFRQRWGRAPAAFRATNGTTHLTRP